MYEYDDDPSEPREPDYLTSPQWLARQALGALLWGECHRCGNAAGDEGLACRRLGGWPPTLSTVAALCPDCLRTVSQDTREAMRVLEQRLKDAPNETDYPEEPLFAGMPGRWPDKVRRIRETAKPETQ